MPDLCRCGTKKDVYMKRGQKEAAAEASRPGQMHSSDEGCTSQCTRSGQERGQGLWNMHCGRVGSLDHPWLSCQTMRWVLSLTVHVHRSQYRGLHLSEHRQRSSYLARISPTCFLRGLMFDHVNQSSLFVGSPNAPRKRPLAKAVGCLKTGKTNSVQNTEIPTLFLSEILRIAWVVLGFY